MMVNKALAFRVTAGVRAGIGEQGIGNREQKDF
jgi:hypothetical protein